MVEKKKTLELKKHVAAIHSGNKLSLLQRKIANALLFNAYESMFDKEEHEIHIPSLCKLIGYDSNDHKTIKKTLVDLLSTVIEWNLVDGKKIDSEGVWNASSMIADASIEGAICTYSYSNKMKKLLHRPELYGRLNMYVQAKFQSTYGLALYENCIRYQNIAQTPWLEILKFRKLMGIEEGKYKIFRDFKSRVLNKAIEEVNKFSPIFISPQFQKKGRQVTGIQFTIKNNDQKNISDINYSDSKLPLSTILKSKFGLSKTQIENILSAHDEDYILEKISIVESSPSFIKGTIKNLAKYLLSALKDDYQQTKTTKLIVDKVDTNCQKIIEGAKQEEDNRSMDKKIIKKFEKIPGSKKTAIVKEFEKYIRKGLYYSIYQRDGMSNVLVQDQLCRYIREHKPDFVKTLNKSEEETAVYDI